MTEPSSPPSPSSGSFAPGATIGIIGGGQLGRMTVEAAKKLGFKSHIFTPEENSPAGQLADSQTIAAYDDQEALHAFASAVDVVTFEFENIPHESVAVLSEHIPVRPDWNVLRISQDRIVEKDFINRLGIETAPWQGPLKNVADLQDAVSALGRPAVLKSTRLGYDGKGQAKIDADTDLAQAWSLMGSDEGILEGFVDFDMEISVIVARGLSGEVAAFDAVENRHANHILDVTIAPAPISDALASAARTMAEKIAVGLGLIGLLAVELFVTKDERLLVNEIAPRPHNSGHWTIEGCQASQFEQFVRAVTGLALGNPKRVANAEMKNLIGEDVNAWDPASLEEGQYLHLYGKTHARPGRKMGHVTRLSPKS